MSKLIHLLVGLTAFGAIRIQAQPTKDILASFLDEMRVAHSRILLIAEGMPSEKYVFRATPRQETFADLVASAGNASSYFCGRLSGIRDTIPSMTGREPKDEATAKLRRKLLFCDRAGRALEGADFGQVIEESGPRSRAAVMVRATAFWSGMLSQVEMYLRMNDLVPMRPCNAPFGEEDCDNSINRCVTTTPMLRGLRLTLADEPYSVRSDGRGPYVQGQENVIAVVASRAAVMVLGPTTATTGTAARPRAITVDLSRPVPGGGGAPLGIVVDSSNLEVAAQWSRDSGYVARSVRDIPVGTTVEARQLDVGFHIDGVYHVLQMGPQPYGHCFSDGTSIHGSGTTPGTITRVATDKWTIHLPAGSIGRLFDNHLSSPHAVDKGLYYVSLRFDLER